MEETASMDNKQFVAFKLGKEEYGIETIKVTTIVKMLPIARVPRTEEYIKGVINLRGEIIPIMDLRIKFNLPEIEKTEDTRTIIVKIDDVPVGIIVDSVEEVIQLPESSIENITNFSSDRSMDYVYGVGKVEERIVTLLNLEKLVNIPNNEQV